MIYYVEDDESIRELVLYTLRSAGFEARGFETGAGFLSVCERETPELILLDIMLPGKDGNTLLREIRENAATSRVPVVMLTAKGAEYDKVVSLDGGADDYVVKPFGMMELVSRVRAILRRGGVREASPVLSWRGVRMDTKLHELSADGVNVSLTVKEYDVLRLFLEHPDRVYTREQLLDEVWGYEYAGGTRTVDVHMQTLRQKLGAYGEAIETVRGVGYRLGRES